MLLASACDFSVACSSCKVNERKGYHDLNRLEDFTDGF